MWYCVKNPFHWHSQIAFQLLLKVEIWTHFYKLHMIFQHWNRRPCVSTKKKYLRRKCSPSSLSFWSWSSSCISDSIEVKSVKFDNSKSAKSLAMKQTKSEKNTKCVLLLRSCFLQCQDLTPSFEVYSMIGSPSLHPRVRSSKDAALTDSWKSMRIDVLRCSPPAGY